MKPTWGKILILLTWQTLNPKGTFELCKTSGSKKFSSLDYMFSVSIKKVLLISVEAIKLGRKKEI